jgi:hypothetical protein
MIILVFFLPNTNGLVCAKTYASGPKKPSLPVLKFSMGVPRARFNLSIIRLNYLGLVAVDDFCFSRLAQFAIFLLYKHFEFPLFSLSKANFLDAFLYCENMGFFHMQHASKELYNQKYGKRT